MTLADHARDYQTLLELHRRDPDDEHVWADLQKARAAMEIAWLTRTTIPPQRMTRRCDHGNYARGLAEIPMTGSWANGYLQ